MRLLKKDLTDHSGLVTNFLVAEVLSSQTIPNYTLWLISPWITNFSLSLPSSGDLTSLIESAEQTPRLFEVIQQIIHNTGQVYVVVQREKDLSRAEQFIHPLMRLRFGLSGLHLRQHHDLHAKIYAGQCAVLSGSLNLTETGVNRNIEFPMYASDERNQAKLRSMARSIYEKSQDIP